VSRPLQVFWSLTLLMFLTACSGYRHIESPAFDDVTESTKETVYEIKIGSTVRLTTAQDEVIDGKLLSVNRTTCRVLVEGQPSLEREIILSDIVEAEVKESLTFPIIVTCVLLVSVGLIVLYNSVKDSQ